jgi:CubicO group peptidase (beta-lactamase class C family)
MRLQIALAAALMAVAFPACARPKSNEHIQHVEHGLRLPIAVQGAPDHGMDLAERMRAWGVPGVSIAVINDGKIEWARGYGVLEAGGRQAVTPATRFQAASISKMVTACAALALAERGKVDLDQDVNQLLGAWKIPASPELQQAPVTLRRLLSHTSGIPGDNLDGYAPDGPVPSLLQVLDGIAPANSAPIRVNQVPGSAYRYAGGGYAVIQLLLAERNGASFPATIESLVLHRAGMNHSSFAAPAAGSAAIGHDLQGKPVPGRWHVYPELAAAGLWSTPSDVAKLMLALQRSAAGQPHSLLSAASARQMMTPVLDGYGLGLELDHDGPQPTFAHSGSNLGYKAMAFAYAGSGKGAVVMTNGDYGGQLVDEILRAIAVEYGWPDYRQQVKAAVPHPAHLERYAGEYSIGGLPLLVTAENGKLYVEARPLGPQKLELIPESDERFFLREKNSTLSFVLNGDAPVAEVSFFDFGRPRPGKRVR